MAAKKKGLGEWHGPGFISGRASTPLPHMGGPKGVGAEGPKRLSPKASTAKKTTKARSTTLKDKYGRRITRAEYERREKFRERRKSMTASQAERATKTEMKRRAEWRKAASSKRVFGSAATSKTRNKDLATGVSSRYVAAATKRASKGMTADRAERTSRTIRSKYKGKK